MESAARVFEWDERKRRGNLRRHGLDFADCGTVFSGPTITRRDDRFDYGELRYRTLGLLCGRVVSVAHTEDDDGVVRVISLRKAVKHEQAVYFQTFQNQLETGRRSS
jgi:uncharacterized protein